MKIYYRKELKKHSKMYGYNDYLIHVYRVYRGELVKIGETRQRTGSTCGDFGEVWHVLRTAGLVPKQSDIFDGSPFCAYGYANKHKITIRDIADIYA